MAAASGVHTKPALHVEVRIESASGGFVRTDLVREEVLEFLLQEFVSLKLNESVTGYEGTRQSHTPNSCH